MDIPIPDMDLPESDEEIESQEFLAITCNSEENCSICMENMSSCQVNVLACSHVFHVTCLTPWRARHSTCPLCRGRITHIEQSE